MRVGAIPFVNRQTDVMTLVNRLSSSGADSALTVLVGVGGFGKSALAVQVAREMVEQGRMNGRLIDLYEPNYRSYEGILLDLRSTISLPFGRLPHSDWALATYWSSVHPGQGLADRFAEVDRQAKSVFRRILPTLAEDALGGAGIPFASSIHALAREMRDHRTSKVRFEAIRGQFPDLPENPAAVSPHEWLNVYPQLLEVELSQASGSGGSAPWLILDSWESVTGDRELNRGIDQTLEGQLARLVLFAPSVRVLLVSTSTPDFSWLDGQHARVIEIHRLESMSSDHIAEIARLSMAPNCAVEPGAVAAVAHGVPLVARLLAESGEDPGSAGDIQQDYVDHLLQALDDRAIQIVALAAMVGAVSLELVQRISPRITRKVFERTVASAMFVQQSSDHILPWRLQAQVLAAVTVERVGWGRRRRSDVAAEALDYLGECWDRAINERASGNQGSTLALFQYGVGALRFSNEVPNWLLDAAYQLRLLRATDALYRASEEMGSDVTSAFRRLAATAAGMAAREDGDYARARVLLSDALEMATIAGAGAGLDERVFISHRLAKVLQLTGETDEAERLLLEAASADSPFAPTAEKDFAFLAIFTGHPQEALTWCAPRIREGRAGRAVEWLQALDLHGWVAWTTGDMGAAVDWFGREVAEAQSIGTPHFLNAASRHLALSLCWLSSEAEFERVLELAEPLNRGYAIGEAQLEIAQAVFATRSGVGRNEVLLRLDRAEELLESASDRTELWIPALARAYLAASTRSVTELRQIESRLIRHQQAFGVGGCAAGAAAIWLRMVNGRFDLAAGTIGWHSVLDLEAI